MIDVVDSVLARLELPPELAEVSTARRFVRRQLAGSVSADALADLMLMTSELVTNAVEHGLVAPVVLTISQDDDAVSISVESSGPSPGVGPARSWVMADADDITGRGLGIVRHLADVVDVERDASRLLITARRRTIA